MIPKGVRKKKLRKVPWEHEEESGRRKQQMRKHEQRYDCSG